MYPPTRPEPTLPCEFHDWEAGTWGVIVGVSKCKRCGKVCAQDDFDIPPRTKEADDA